MDVLWTTFASQVSNEDVRVRESLIKACSQIITKDGSWATKVQPIFLECIQDKARVAIYNREFVIWQFKIAKFHVVSFYLTTLYKAIAVRERTLEAITDIACQDVKLISDEIWRYVFQHIYEKKERPRQCAITCLSSVWISLDDKHKRVKDKILDQLRKGYANVGRQVKRGTSARGNSLDYEKPIKVLLIKKFVMMLH